MPPEEAVDGPMAEYQRDKRKSIQTDKAKPDRRRAGENGVLAAEMEESAEEEWGSLEMRCFGID